MSADTTPTPVSPTGGETSSASSDGTASRSEDLPAATPRHSSYAWLAAQENLSVGLNRILGELASWAVQQSPYDAPDGLAEAITGFKDEWPRGEYAEFNGIRDLEAAIMDTFTRVPAILLWNERKNGNQSPFGFTTRYSAPHPDNDFIDLDALARNMAMHVWHDAADFKASNDDFDSRWAKREVGPNNASPRSDEKDGDSA